MFLPMIPMWIIVATDSIVLNLNGFGGLARQAGHILDNKQVLTSKVKKYVLAFGISLTYFNPNRQLLSHIKCIVVMPG